MNILVAGSSGLVGSALMPVLRAAGHSVTMLVRRPATAKNEISWDPEAGILDHNKLSGMDAVVNLCGAGIADARWTPVRRRILRQSRIKSTETLVKAIERSALRPRVLLNASAIGFYGNRGHEVVTEYSAAGFGYLTDLCVDWERAAYSASPLDLRVICLRIGMVLSSRGGLMAKLRPLFNLGLGAKLGGGEQWMSWISSTDLVRVIQTALEDERYAGPVNAVTQYPVTNGDFTAMLAALMHRPAILNVPGWALKGIFGEMAEGTMLSSCRVLPAKLMDCGFAFEHRELPDALLASLPPVEESGK